jgi:uncharacterized protein with ATP-grasp and redox domains
MPTTLAFDLPSLPPPLMNSEERSFAHRTIVERIPRIIDDVIADVPYPGDIVWALKALKGEIATAPIQPIGEEAADRPFWLSHWQRYAGKGWLELPWYFAETYFYRRLLEATRYFQEGPWQGVDPFAGQKRRGLESGGPPMIAQVLATVAKASPWEAFVTLLHSSLWGNRADLSNVELAREAAEVSPEQERENLLKDDTSGVWSLLADRVARVDFINDNAGPELLLDLCLADFLLTGGQARQVQFHLKSYPFYVSDAMIRDAEAALAALAGGEESGTRELARRLESYLAEERLVLRDQGFWTTCLHFWDMPGDLQGEMAQADLVILKGDVNYRRLLGDLHWPYTTPIEAIVSYFPASFVTLRTLKSEIIVGLEAGVAEELSREDPTWLINGKRGVIQFVHRGDTERHGE